MKFGKSQIKKEIYEEAISEKIFSAEKNVSFLRLITVLFNSIVYVLFINNEPFPALAYTIIVVANSYSLYVILAKPYRKYPIFLASYFTYCTDAILITLWLLATGSYNSPFFALWYLSIVAVAFRFTYTVTISTSFLYSICYVFLIAFNGGIEGHLDDVVVRIGYIFLVGIAGTIITKETFTQTKEKVLMQKLAQDAQKAEKTLTVQKNLYESLLSAQSEMGEGISITDGVQFKYVNNALCKIYGYSEEELLAMPSYLDLIDPEEKNRLTLKHEKRTNNDPAMSDFGETIVRNKTGERVFITYITKKVEVDNRIQLFSIIRDITKRKAEEENLYKLAAIVETSEDAIIYKSLDFKIVNWNVGAERIYGYKAAEIIGESASKIVPADLLEEENELMQRIIMGEHINHFETFRVHKSGNKIAVSLSLSVIKDEGGVIKGYSSIARDISERKDSETKLLLKTKELTRSNAELEMFAFAASHDLQEPLRKIRMFGDMLSEKYKDSLDEDGKSYIKRMQGASIRMQSLINDVLTLSRLNKKKQALIDTNVNDILLEVINDLDFIIKQKQALVTIENIIPSIKGVPFQIGQLFQNLITNSLKYCKAGVPPRINIRSEIIAGHEISDIETPFKDRHYCRIYFSDNGIGLDEKYSKRIFVAFQRLHGREEFEGTGIGLAICKKVIDNHQGFVSVKSQPNEGATFIVSLPIS